MSRFFINRPIFASVISIIIVIAGLVTLYNLPVAQYPEISPPTVQVTASYPGASAKVVSETVAQPIEEQVNGVEGMMYMSSTCSSDGSYQLTVTFEVGTDMDMATVLVQNRVAIAESSLPDTVKRLGVTTKKRSTDIVLMLALTSPEKGFDGLYLSNYATLNIKDELARLNGVGDVAIFGAGDYSMRVWLDPELLKVRDLTTNDVAAAIEEQNVQVAAGQIGQSPAPEGQDFQYVVNARGRLEQAEQFGEIIVKSERGRVTRLKDLGRIELGSKAYGVNSRYKGTDTALLAVYQLPGANALDLSERVLSKMDELEGYFPQGLTYEVPLNTTDFVRASINEVVQTLFIAVILVFMTIFVFLQDWRATLIPAATIPVSLIGTFAVMGLLGFSLNMLTLFGLVLAIGIVVDDAIVVVENTSRNIDELGLDPKEATIRAMQEVSGPVVSTTLVLLSVFVPTASMGGITGQMYMQFALTIAASTVFSALNALTLSPALSALVLRPSKQGRKNILFRGFNRVFDGGHSGYMRFMGGLVRKPLLVLMFFLILSAATGWGFMRLPTGFLPTEDQGYVMATAQLPDGASFRRSQEVAGLINNELTDMDGIKSW
ncbi:MAG: efflux RND transporter permease subunit, partial [Desulfonatronovibrionaceae bacterium]